MCSNCKKYVIFYFKFVNYTSELLTFESFITNTHSQVENYQPVPLKIINLYHFFKIY